MLNTNRVRRDVVEGIGLFAVARRFDTLKLLRELGANWPDASEAEVQAGLWVAGEYVRGGSDE